MKKAFLVIALGLLLGAAGYFSLYLSQTAEARSAAAAENPELIWLQQEFGLNQKEFARVRDLHLAYLPDCARLCAEIASVNASLEQLVLATNQVTPEISAKLTEIGRLRQQCQSRMLNHFYAVSQSMPEAQGRRYLARMQKLTSLSNMRDHSIANHSDRSAHAEHGH